MTGLGVGITLPTISDGSAAADVAGLARHVEQLGFDSVWVPDLVIGDGTPSLESTVALAVAAAVTERVQVGFGVLALPLRPVAWLATQVATLQHLSGNRVVLGIGTGGFPGTPFWDALGVPGHERGRRTDAALAALPPLIAGEPTRLDHEPSRPTLTLAPPAPVPPILVGGSSPAAIRRAATSGDGWFPSLLPPSALPGHTAELRRQAAAHGRPPPSVTVGGHVVLGNDAAARSAHDALVGSLVDDHGLPPEEAAEVPMRGRGPDELAARFASYAEAGAGHLVVSPEGDDWRRQCERIAEARALLQEDRPAARDPASHDPVDPH